MQNNSTPEEVAASGGTQAHSTQDLLSIAYAQIRAYSRNTVEPLIKDTSV